MTSTSATYLRVCSDGPFGIPLENPTLMQAVGLSIAELSVYQEAAVRTYYTLLDKMIAAGKYSCKPMQPRRVPATCHPTCVAQLTFGRCMQIKSSAFTRSTRRSRSRAARSSCARVAPRACRTRR